jgi:hypothetical protein
MATIGVPATGKEIDALPESGSWSQAERKEGRSELSEIEVRWGGSTDRNGVARILELNSIPGWIAFEERFIVAEERGEILAVVRYRTGCECLLLGPLAVDPWPDEHRFAVALYSGAGKLALEIGLREVWAESNDRREYLLDAGYRRHVSGWHLNEIPSYDELEGLPKSGWRRALSLWGASNIPFFRAFFT